MKEIIGLVGSLNTDGSKIVHMEEGEERVEEVPTPLSEAEKNELLKLL
jgi:hypothetical protein